MTSMWHSRTEGVHAGVGMRTKVCHHQSNTFSSTGIHPRASQADRDSRLTLKYSCLSQALSALFSWMQVSGRRNAVVLGTIIPAYLKRSPQTVFWDLSVINYEMWALSSMLKALNNNKHSARSLAHTLLLGEVNCNPFNRLTLPEENMSFAGTQSKPTLSWLFIRVVI